MTVANQTARTSATGTAAAGQEIPFSFPAGATSDIKVRTRLTSTGVQSDPLTETTHYTVSLSGDVGGTVTMVSAVAATYTIHVYRETPRTQSLDLEAGGTFNGENVEDALDKAIRAINDLYDRVSRCIQMPATDASLDMELDSSVDRASNYLAFTAAGGVTVVDTVAPSTATVTAAGQDLIDDASAAAQRTTMGVAIGTNVQAYDAQLDKISALATTNSAMIVGDDTNFVLESGGTLRTSIGTLAETEACRVDASHAYTGTGVGFTDEDDMLSNLPLAPPSEQSVKAFVNSIVGYNGDVVMYLDEVVTYV